MTRAQYFREQAIRADRLARNVLDTVTVARLTEASRDYRQQADMLEREGAGALQHDGISQLKTRTERSTF